MSVRTKPPAPGNQPVRTCVGCKERAAKSSLLRLVVAGDGIVPDPQARQPGRGAYLHPTPACFELAQRRRAFPRALRVPGPLSVAPLASYLSRVETGAQHNQRRQRGTVNDDGKHAGHDGNLYGKQVEKLMSAR